MGGEDDDPIGRRAAEIRAEQEVAASNEASHDGRLRNERARFVRQFLDALTERTSHAVECVAVDVRPHGAIARFHFLRDGKAWIQNMFEFGIDRAEGTAEAEAFLYYLMPTAAGFAIPNPATGVPRELRNSSLGEVLNYATAISIEMLARVVAAGGVLGTADELNMLLAEQEDAERIRRQAERRQRSKEWQTGCGIAAVEIPGAVLGIAFLIGVLGSIVRACSVN